MKPSRLRTNVTQSFESCSRNRTFGRRRVTEMMTWYSGRSYPWLRLRREVGRTVDEVSHGPCRPSVLIILLLSVDILFGIMSCLSGKTSEVVFKGNPPSISVFWRIYPPHKIRPGVNSGSHYPPHWGSLRIPVPQRTFGLRSVREVWVFPQGTVDSSPRDQWTLSMVPGVLSKNGTRQEIWWVPYVVYTWPHLT